MTLITPARTFDFEGWQPHARDVGDVVRAFAAHDALRSAAVEELELDDEFHRRAVRPEDLSFISFGRAVTRETVTQLPFLAANRMLLAIHEMGVAGLPRDGRDESFARVAAFCDDEHAIGAAQILPFLESFAFDFLEREPHLELAASPAALEGTLAGHLRAEAVFWSRAFERFRRTGYVEEGLRYGILQRAALAPSKRVALARAVASRFFAPFGAEASPRLDGPAIPDAEVHRLATRVGVGKTEHSYWQFYLSTSLASVNLLHALARRPDRALRAYGAAFAAEAEWLAFGCLLGLSSRALQRDDAPRTPWPMPEGAGAAELTGRFARGLVIVEKRWGARGLAEVARGLTLATGLATVARANLAEQLRWLSSVGVYQEIARRIDARVQAECPDIDRETFIEPREMCSTTHVHDDHRLVVIEKGNMVFWGNVGMTLRLAPGEMVLVPQGRLHGSSIESDECTYHQPIIPDAWVRALVADLDPGGAALVG